MVVLHLDPPQGRAARLRAFRGEYHASLQRALSWALLLELVDGLFRHPAIPVPGAARQLKVTQRAAFQNIGRLVRAGILAEATGRPRIGSRLSSGCVEGPYPLGICEFPDFLVRFLLIDGAPGTP